MFVEKHSLQKNSWKKESRYVCMECGKAFLHIDTLTQHRLSHRVKMPNCGHCNNIFSNPVYLNEHMAVHARIGEVSYPIEMSKCSHCDKICSNPVYLNDHMTVHTRIKGHYICQECGKVFFENKTLKQHMLVHSTKMSKCNYFDLIFSNPVYLEVHTKTGAYKCEECVASFGCLDSLNKHRLIHKVEKLHKDFFCDHTYCQKETMDQHFKIKIHTSDIYQCTECDKAVDDQSNSVKHTMMHHSNSLTCHSRRQVPMSEENKTSSDYEPLWAVDGLVIEEEGTVIEKEGKDAFECKDIYKVGGEEKEIIFEKEEKDDDVYGEETMIKNEEMDDLECQDICPSGFEAEEIIIKKEENYDWH